MQTEISEYKIVDNDWMIKEFLSDIRDYEKDVGNLIVSCNILYEYINYCDLGKLPYHLYLQMLNTYDPLIWAKEALKDFPPGEYSIFFDDENLPTRCWIIRHFRCK